MHALLYCHYVLSAYTSMHSLYTSLLTLYEYLSLSLSYHYSYIYILITFLYGSYLYVLISTYIDSSISIFLY
ncbi:hypothetical protein BRC_ANJCRFCP_CDS_0057 [Friunavirus sp. BRC001]